MDWQTDKVRYRVDAILHREGENDEKRLYKNHKTFIFNYKFISYWCREYTQKKFSYKSNPIKPNLT